MTRPHASAIPKRMCKENEARMSPGPLLSVWTSGRVTQQPWLKGCQDAQAAVLLPTYPQPQTWLEGANTEHFPTYTSGWKEAIKNQHCHFGHWIVTKFFSIAHYYFRDLGCYLTSFNFIDSFTHFLLILYCIFLFPQDFLKLFWNRMSPQISFSSCLVDASYVFLWISKCVLLYPWPLNSSNLKY